MKRNLIIAILILLANAGFSQASKKPKCSFSSVTQFGILSGSQRDAFLIQTINGIVSKNWAAGIGVGIDNYSERSVPFFIDIRKKFGNNANAPFVYADGGINFGWLNFIQRSNRSLPKYKQPSWYYDAGIGWRISLKNKSAILMSAGYTLKQLKGERTNFNGPIIGGQRTQSREHFENTYRRLAIKIGIQL
jgi:hypothetical protein